MALRAKVTRSSDYDPDPDLSYLGTFDMEPKSEAAIDMRERPGFRRGHFPWFNPCNPEYAEQDLARMEAYEAGDWTLVYLAVHVECGGLEAEARCYGVEDEFGANEWHEEVYQDLTRQAFDAWRERVHEVRRTWCRGPGGYLATA